MCLQLPWTTDHRFVVNAETNYALELYGAGSLCFEHGSPEGNTGVGAESDTCDCLAVDAEVNYVLELYGAGSLCFEHGSPEGNTGVGRSLIPVIVLL